jgi:hypothetical protein
MSGLQSIREVQATNLGNGTIEAKLKYTGYMLAEGAIIK